MSTIDLSRSISDRRKNYAGVRHQQGRVLTDDDFNEASVIEAEELRRTRLHTIGAYGSPNDGFLPKTFTTGLGGKLDFTLSAGELYLGGLRLELPQDETFLEQRDWVNLDPAASEFPAKPANGASRTDLVWIEAWQQPVTAVEDGELFDVAMGGPDTTTRWRTMRRVHLMEGVGGASCPAAWAQAVANFAAMGTPDEEMRLATAARLSVSFNAAPGPGDLCSPMVAGGYLGAENQAIRVQMVDPANYTWGYDNAAPLYRAVVSSKGGNKVLVTLLNAPRDAMHWPLSKQVVELLPWSAVLPNGELVADLSGHLCKVAVSYDPDNLTFEIDVPLPAGYDHWKARSDVSGFWNGSPTGEYVFVRMWNRGDELASPAAIPIATAALGNTGLSVSFSGGPLRPGDYWVIAARPAAPDAVMPWRLSLPSGAPPIGIDRFRAPLGLINWSTSGSGTVTGMLVDDCRPPFLPLTRVRGCCKVTVGDGIESFGMFSSINAAIAALPSEGGEVCVLPGIYREAVRVEGLANIHIHGCGPRSRIVAPDLEGAGSTAILIRRSDAIAVERLALEGGNQAVVWIDGSRRIQLRECLVQFRDLRERFSPWPAIFAAGEDLEIEDNIVEPLPDELPVPFHKTAAAAHSATAHSARGGIQLAGGCERVAIFGNVIAGGRGNGITLGSILRIDEEHPGGIGVVDVDNDDPCAPCLPNDGGGDGGGDTVRYVSAGDLYDIEIIHNIVVRHGANGIAVVRFFAPKGQNFAMVVVHSLRIADNVIARCLRREIAAVADGQLLYLGYGGIALAVVIGLTIEYNRIEANGVDWLDPVCGIFALMVDGLRICDNIVRDNGPASGESPEGARPGVRAGIHIWFALPLGGSSGSLAKTETSAVERSRLPRGRPGTIRIHGNEVDQPLGRALFLLGAGPMLITDNRLVSHALAERVTDRFARTVLVGNFGASKEWTLGLFYALILAVLEAFGHNIAGNLKCSIARIGAFTRGFDLPAWPTGKLDFRDNQVGFAMADPPQGFDASSVLLVSLDAVSANDNSFEYHVREPLRRWVLSDLIALGMTTMTNDNRLAETWGRAFFSIYSLGLMNTAADNQSTHCLNILGYHIAKHHNLVLGEVFCDGLCARGGADQVTGELATGAHTFMHG